MSHRKDYPIDVLKAIEPFLKRDETFIKRVVSQHSQYLIRYHDIEKPAFYFEISSYDTSQNPIHFVIKYCPSSTKSLTESRLSLTAEHFNGQFEGWLKLLREYENLLGPHDTEEEIAQKQAEKEFFDIIAPIDENDRQSYFTFEQQVLLDQYLDYIIKELESVKTESNREIIENIQIDVRKLQEMQTELNKGTVLKMLAAALAKTKKVSIKFAQKIFSKLIEETINGLINCAVKQIGGIS